MSGCAHEWQIARAEPYVGSFGEPKRLRVYVVCLRCDTFRERVLSDGDGRG